VPHPGDPSRSSGKRLLWEQGANIFSQAFQGEPMKVISNFLKTEKQNMIAFYQRFHFLTHWYFHVIYLALMLLLYFYVDQPVASLFHQYHTTFTCFEPIQWFGIGSLYVLIFFVFAVILHQKSSFLQWRNRMLFTASWMLLTYGICFVMKSLIGRARPSLMLENQVFGFYGPTLTDTFRSFPSGHTTTIVALAAAASLFYPRWTGRFFMIALLLALTRVILTWHYCSDVFLTAYLTLVEFVIGLRLMEHYSENSGSR
jgi:membrane-associated phospholipid phosphatase